MWQETFEPPRRIAYCQLHKNCKIFSNVTIPWENLVEWLKRGTPEPRGVYGTERDKYGRRHKALWDSAKQCCKAQTQQPAGPGRG